MKTKFKDFINESYLKGSRQPLYHFTNNLINIMKDDTLKPFKAADNKISISFTRCLYSEEFSTETRIVLNSDKLKDDGYKIFPYDEVGNILTKNPKKCKNKLKGYSKANPNKKIRSIINKVGYEWDKSNSLEWEYEERCFTEIKNIGKYIIAIDLTKNKMNFLKNNKIFNDYLKKYSNIKIILLKNNKYDRRTQFDKEKRKIITNKEKHIKKFI